MNKGIKPTDITKIEWKKGEYTKVLARTPTTVTVAVRGDSHEITISTLHLKNFPEYRLP